MDDWFDIDVEPDGTFLSHDYADRVPNCRNTWNRLSQDYYDLGKTVMELPDFPEGKASLPGVSGESVYVSAHLAVLRPGVSRGVQRLCGGSEGGWEFRTWRSWVL